MSSRERILLSAAEERELREAGKTQWVDDVPGAFTDIPVHGAKLELNTRGSFPDRPSYTKARDNGGGNENHFQGCQRLGGGAHLAVCGGDWRNKSSHVFVARLGSRVGRTWWGSNLGSDGPPVTDLVVARLDLHPRMWHAGGLDLYGDLLAVPVECGRTKGTWPRGVKPPKCKPARSRIYFVYVKDPGNPKILSSVIDRRTTKATAVALSYVPGTGYVAAVLSACEPTETRRGKRIDLYRTEGTAINGGFSHWGSFKIPKTTKFEDYQIMNSVNQSARSHFLLCMTEKLADLFKVTLPTDDSRPNLEFLARREFELDRRYADFKAGAGFFAHNNALALYAVPQWRRRTDGRLGLTEWAP